MKLYEIVRQHTNLHYIITYLSLRKFCTLSQEQVVPIQIPLAPINKNIKRSSLTKTPYYKWL